MILVVSREQDLATDFVTRHLKADGQPFLQLNTEQLGSTDCHFGHDREPLLQKSGVTIPASAISAAWFRRFAQPQILEQTTPEHREFTKRELAATMDAFLESIPSSRTINPAEADRLSGNRLFQSNRARALGLKVPASLVTQCVHEARAFIDAYPAVITKAISFGRVASPESGEDLFAHTSPITARTDLSGVAVCPALLQERVEKSWEWRVTSVGSRLFGARIPASEDTATDWRQRPDALTGFQPAKLPDDIAHRLVSLAKQSGLIYGAHDLIETPDGQFVFLETNPAGQWAWLEVTLGLPIGRAIANELIERSNQKP